jgi:hypothetical protein
MMNDRFAAQLRKHLLETADERPGDGRLEAIDERIAVTAQRPRLVARLGWFPGRVDPFASGAVRYALIAAALIVAIVAAALAAGVGSPSASGGFGGIVHYQLDGGPATTEVAVVADGASVSGTAVTTFRGGTHTVRLGCATQNGDTWALGGTTEQTTVAGERAGDWSAVIVKNGPPQQIGIWLGDDPSQASDCEAWLASIDFATIGAEHFNALESGSLVPPPVSAP